MGRCNVEYKGKYAGFSTMCDAFLTKFMDKSDYEKWRNAEYSLNILPLEFNTKSIEGAAFSIRLNRNHDEGLECLLESGLSKEESEQIMYDLETKYYVPIPKGNGMFQCPNCQKEIKRNQLECDDDACSLEFVWRI